MDGRLLAFGATAVTLGVGAFLHPRSRRGGRNDAASSAEEDRAWMIEALAFRIAGADHTVVARKMVNVLSDEELRGALEHWSCRAVPASLMEIDPSKPGRVLMAKDLARRVAGGWNVDLAEWMFATLDDREIALAWKGWSCNGYAHVSAVKPPGAREQATRRQAKKTTARQKNVAGTVAEPVTPDSRLPENHRRVLLAMSRDEDTELTALAQALYGGNEPGQRDAARQIANRLIHKKLIEPVKGSKYHLTAEGERQQAVLRKIRSK